MIELTYATGTLPPDRKAVLAAELGATLLRWEGAPDTQVFRDITWSYLHELPRDHVIVDGRPAADVAPRYRVSVTVPTGALSVRRRDGLIAEVTRLVLDAVGAQDDDQASMRVWVLVHEMPDGWWGAAGAPVHVEALKALAAHERTQGAGAPAEAPSPAAPVAAR